MADRYWVGGTAAWDGTVGTKWSATSGGAGGASVPTSADAVFFNAASGAVTCTISTGNTGALSINCTGFTGTLAGTATINVFGSITLVSGMTFSHTGIFGVVATSTITSGGKSFGQLQLSASGGTFTLGDALDVGSATTLIQGTLNLNGFTATTATFSSSNTNTRAITFGTSNIVLDSTSAGATILNMATLTGFSYTGTGGFTRNNTTTATVASGNTAGGTVSNAPNLSVTGGSATLTITLTTSGVFAWFKNLDCTGFNGFLTATVVGGLYEVFIAGNFTASNFATNDITPHFRATGTLTAGVAQLRGLIVGGGTVTLGSALNCLLFELNDGTFTTSNFSVTTGTLATSGATAKVLNFGSSTITVTGRTFNAGASNLTVNAGTSIISMTGAGLDKTFTGGSKTYYELRQSGVAVLIIVGSNTFNDLTYTATGNTNFLFEAGATQTFSNFSVSGTAPYSVGIESQTRGSTFTLSKASGTVNASRLFIRDSTATGGATWNATDSLSLANNTGWNITNSTGRYWVGGTASWDGTAGTKWATSSGGAGGATVPGFVDPVYFDAASGSNTVTVATGNFGCFGVSCTGFTGTLTGTGSLFTSGNITLVSGMTFSYSGTITVSVGSVITSAGKTFGGISFSATFDTLTLADNLTLTGQFSLSSGTLNLANFTLSAASFSSSNSNVRSIAFGSGNIALTSTTAAATVLSMSNANNFSYTGTGGFTRNQAATATVTFGVTNGSITNAPNLAITGGASALTVTTNSWFNNLDFTGSTCTVTSSGLNMAGNLTLASGGTYSFGVVTFRDSGAITSSGKTFDGPIIDAPGATVTLADAFSAGATTFTLTAGTFTTSGFSVTAGSFLSSNSNVRALNLGSSTFTVTGGGASAFSIATANNMTVNAGTSVIALTSGSAKTFSGGGRTYYNLDQGGLGAMTIAGSNTFNSITNTVKNNSVVFTAGTTQTVSNFAVQGIAGQPTNISSSTPGSQFTLSKAFGVVSVDYLGIQDSNATGGASWYAGTNSTNISNNTGWTFTAPPSPGGSNAFFLMFN